MKMASLLQAFEHIAYEPLFGLAIASSVLCLMGSAGAWLATHRSAAFRFCVWQMVGVAILVSTVVLLLTPGIPLAGYFARITITQDKSRVEAVGVESRMGKAIEAGESQKEFGVRENASAIALVESSIDLEGHSSPPIERSVTETVPKLLASIAAVWLGLVFIHACALAWSFYRAYSIASHSASAPNNVTAILEVVKRRLGFPSNKVVRLDITSFTKMPLTIGIFRPTIVLPKGYNEWSNSKLEMVLAHELAHVERQDIFWHLIMRLACCVAWFNPLVWRAAKNAVSERERACDDRVLQSGAPATDYGQTLVEIAEGINGRFHALSGIVSIAEPPLQLRLRSILDKSIFRDPIRKRTWIAFASFFIACSFALGIIRPFANPITAQPPSASEPKLEKLSSDTPSTPTEVSLETTADAKAEEGVVTGILVRASDGSAVADATVILHTGGSNKTKSDEQGRFRLENVKPSSWAYPLWAHQGNFITKVVNVKSMETGNPNDAKFAPIRLEMTEGKQAHILVTSAVTQLPIEGAAVRFGYPDRRLVRTDEKGVVIVQGLMPKWPFDGGYDVTIEAEGYARSALKLELSSSEQITNVKAALTDGGIVRGQVVGEDGQPIAETEIVYRIGNDSGFHGDTFRSDAAGNFRHQFLPLNTLITISTEKKDFLTQKLDVTLSEKQRESHVRIILPARPKGGSVVGIVTDERGKPIADVTVKSHGRNSDQGVRESKTDNEGRFELHDLFHVLHRSEITLAAKGFAPQTIDVKPFEANASEIISIVLKPGRAIDGQIKLENGQPARGAMITPRSGDFHDGIGDSITVDDEGKFHLDSLPDDVRFDVQLKRYATMHNVALELERSEPIVITLESPGIIRGRVVDSETKNPIPQFRLRLGFSQLREPGDAKGTYSANWGLPGVTFSSEDGRFTAEPFTNGMPFEFTVDAVGYEPSVLPRVVASNANDAQEVIILLTPRRSVKPYTLSVQFRDEAGKPISDTQLRLIVSTTQPTGRNDNAYNWALIESGQLGQKSYVEQYLGGTTDMDGQCTFRNILPGKYLQLAYWGKGVPTQRTLAFDVTRSGESDNVIIDIPRPSLVRGIVDRSKFPNAGSIRISTNSESFLDFKTELADDQSMFEIRDLPPGKFWVSVVDKPVRFKENGHVMFRQSSLASKELILKPGDEIEVKFDTPDPPR